MSALASLKNSSSGVIQNRSIIDNTGNRELTPVSPRHGYYREKRFLLGYMGAVALISALALGYVSQRAAITSQELATTVLRRQLSELSEKRESLRMEVTRLTALDRIDRIAREELQMVDASEAYIVSRTGIH